VIPYHTHDEEDLDDEPDQNAPLDSEESSSVWCAKRTKDALNSGENHG
jgi:hypothetical protein